jgi:DNA-binding NarL/FixJ family response regulator
MPQVSCDQRRVARILIVDSHPIVRAGLRQIIARDDDLLVCAARVLQSTRPTRT